MTRAAMSTNTPSALMTPEELEPSSGAEASDQEDVQGCEVGTGPRDDGAAQEAPDLDPYLARLLAGDDPRAGADEEPEDDLAPEAMADVDLPPNAFVDSIAAEDDVESAAATLSDSEPDSDMADAGAAAAVDPPLAPPPPSAPPSPPPLPPIEPHRGPAA